VKENSAQTDAERGGRASSSHSAAGRDVRGSSAHSAAGRDGRGSSERSAAGRDGKENLALEVDSDGMVKLWVAGKKVEEEVEGS